MKATVLIIKNNIGQILFLLRKKSPFGWALPGGKVEDGETSEIALIREVLEETGLSISIEEITFVGTKKSVTGTDVDVYTVTINGSPEAKINKAEHSHWKWMAANMTGIVYAGNTSEFVNI